MKTIVLFILLISTGVESQEKNTTTILKGPVQLSESLQFEIVVKKSCMIMAERTCILTNYKKDFLSSK